MFSNTVKPVEVKPETDSKYASNKLKLFIPTSQKTTYNERKKLSILYCKELLFNKNLTTNLEYFNKHTKKDDLADCLLQGIHYLHINNKLKL